MRIWLVLMLIGCGGSTHPLNGTWEFPIVWPEDCTVAMTVDVHDDGELIDGSATKTCGTAPAMSTVEVHGVATRLNPYVVALRFPDYVLVPAFVMLDSNTLSGDVHNWNAELAFHFVAHRRQ